MCGNILRGSDQTIHVKILTCFSQHEILVNMSIDVLCHAFVLSIDILVPWLYVDLQLTRNVQQNDHPSIISGGSRISPRWGRQPSGGPTYDFTNFSKNYMKLTEFRSERVGRLRSAAAIFKFVNKSKIIFSSRNKLYQESIYLGLKKCYRLVCKLTISSDEPLLPLIV